jgi:twinkle protein
MTETPHQPCPYMNCGSSDAFSFNYDKGVGQCFSCGQSYPKRGMRGEVDEGVAERYPLKPMGTGFVPDRQEQRYREIEEDLMDETTTKFTPDGFRGIRKAVRDFYGCYGTMKDGDISAVVYTYPDKSEKVRYLPKEFATRNGFKSDKLFGMEKFPAGSAKAVTITEGEEDAMSAYQMLGHYPVVSLPSATPSRKLLENCKDWLGSFDKIVLSLDSDGKSDKFAMALMNLFPNKVYALPHQENLKDANDYLVAGKQKEYKSAWWAAKPFTPDSITMDAEKFLKMFDETPNHQYVPTNIKSLDEKILGLMQGHFTLFKGPTSCGKTELMRYLEYNFINKYPNIRFGVMHKEEVPLRSLLGVVSYYLEDNLTRKDLVQEKGRTEDVRDAIQIIAENSGYTQFTIPDGATIEDLTNQIRILTQVYGCQYVLFEPIQDCVTMMSVESKEAVLSELAIKLSNLAAELNVGIISIAHTNDDGQIKYCRMLGQRASVIVDLSRDKMSDDLIEANTLRMTVEKNRPCSLNGEAGSMIFDIDTFMLKERGDDW